MKILLADDDATSRLLLRTTLVKLGYEVEVAHDGDQAWSLIQRPDAPQLAILDWMMPGMSGPEICRKLRQRHDARYVYIILLTAMDQINDVIEGIEAGADDYVTKPFHTQELSARLRAGRRILDLQHDLLAAQKDLEIRATHDGLTGLLNHVAILDQLQAEHHRGDREMKTLGVVLLDLDHFKRVNDTFGHAAGDQVLRESARRITSAVRPYDLVGRYGGEEFLIAVPGCDAQQTVRLAERVRQEISAAPVVILEDKIPVTVSLGVSVAIPGEKIDTGLLVELADRALYRAKELGRNRVEYMYVPQEKPLAIESHGESR